MSVPPSLAEAAVAPEASPAEALIRLDGVTKTYEMGRTTVTALNDVSLTIAPGAFVAVVGRSGSGKSTLLHLLAAMETPTAGALAVGPWRLADLSRQEQARYRREMVGMVFQQFNLIPSMTAQQNVALPLILAGADPAVRDARAATCLDLVGLSHRLDHTPVELSGGEQQRVAIARALAADAPVLLCDEPTGNLDSTTGQQILDILRRIHREQGKTILFVTHHPDEVAPLAERVLTLHDGHIVDDA